MWRSHMVIGASSWTALAAIARPPIATDLDARQLACGAVVAAAGALLCDLDTPNSRLAHALGPVTQLAARVIGRVFGGHRGGTHSLAFCALVGALSAVALTQRVPVALTATVTVTGGQLAALLVGYVAAALTVAMLTGLRGARGGALSALVVIAGASRGVSPGLVTAALTTGCVSHLLADCLTPEGIVPLWPLSRRRVSLPLIARTGDRRETVIVVTTTVVTIAAVGGLL